MTPFLPGEKVPISGEYWVVHLQHRLPYKAFLLVGERFPVCKQCSRNVVYEYAGDPLRGVDLSHDVDFLPKRAEWAL
ncbi:MAG TPA: hypothetical protein VGL89_16705 [Candidatus Koribacter sp.]